MWHSWQWKIGPREAEEADGKGEPGTINQLTKTIRANFKSWSSVIRDKNGNILTRERGIGERLEERFEDVLNREPPITPARMESRLSHRIKHSYEEHTRAYRISLEIKRHSPAKIEYYY